MAVTGSGAMRAELLERSDEGAWESFVAGHPQGGIYHSLAWRNVTTDGFGHRPYYLVARDTGGRLAGVLPLFLVRGIFGRRLVSLPMRDRGGVLVSNAEAAASLVTRAIELSKELSCRYLHLKDHGGLDGEMSGRLPLQRVDHWVTTRVDLTVGEEKLWKRLDRDAVRWAINKARKLGVQVEDASNADGLDRFYEIFARTRSRMGIPPFPRALFQAIGRHLMEAGRANLFLASVGSELINGMINFLSRDSIIFAYAAPQREWAKHYPSETIFWHAIQWGARHGLSTADFGADSPSQDGLLRFKKKWGGETVVIPHYYHVNGRSRVTEFDSSSESFGLVRKAWARLPLGVSKQAGAWLTRQLS